MHKTVAKLIVMYNVPERDRELFDKQYFETHVPLAKKMPGLRGMELCRNPRNMMGGASPYYLIATLIFDDMSALKAAMSSPEGQEAGNNIMSFASNYLTMLSSEVEVMEGVLAG
jgi:uncharacterized protein (TIGR02118 family)